MGKEPEVSKPPVSEKAKPVEAEVAKEKAEEPPMPPATKPVPPKVTVSTINTNSSSTSIVSIGSSQDDEQDTMTFVQSVLEEEKKPETSDKYPETSDKYYVQLGSVQNEQRAIQEWDRLQIEFPAEFAGVPHRIQRADLGARGVYYRIQAGAFSQDRSRAICASIKARRPSVGCLVVR